MAPLTIVSTLPTFSGLYLFTFLDGPFKLRIEFEVSDVSVVVLRGNRVITRCLWCANAQKLIFNPVKLTSKNSRKLFFDLNGKISNVKVTTFVVPSVSRREK